RVRLAGTGLAVADELLEVAVLGHVMSSVDGCPRFAAPTPANRGPSGGSGNVTSPRDGMETTFAPQTPAGVGHRSGVRRTSRHPHPTRGSGSRSTAPARRLPVPKPPQRPA